MGVRSICEGDLGFNDEEYTEVLHRYFGKDTNFRSLRVYKNIETNPELVDVSQGEIVADIVKQIDRCKNGLDYEDIFVKAPTGFGKSLLYQLPALYIGEKYKYLTIVVSPLVALMNDQVNKLENKSIHKSCYINSMITLNDKLNSISSIRNGDTHILYISPEMVNSIDLENLLDKRNLGMVVLDEAHVINDWGLGFRPDYLFIGSVLERLQSHSTFVKVFTTATAIYAGKNDNIHRIAEIVGSNNLKVYFGETRRCNIDFNINHIDLKIELEDKRIEFIKSLTSGNKAIAYFPYAKDATSLYEQYNGSSKFKYTGKISKYSRLENENEFKESKDGVLFATKAFGLGVDADNVNSIYHFKPNSSLFDYVQEIGRCARDKRIQGIANIDFYNNDLDQAKTLNRLSELSDFQIQNIIDKIIEQINLTDSTCNKIRLNFWDFAWMFEYGSDFVSKAKIALYIIEQDLRKKYGQNVISVNPSSMASTAYMAIPNDLIETVTKKYAGYIFKIGGCDYGVIYRFNLMKMWERFGNESSYKTFVKALISKKYTVNHIDKKLDHMIKLDIIYKESYTHAKSMILQYAYMLDIFLYARFNSTFKVNDLISFMKMRGVKLSATKIKLLLGVIISGRYKNDNRLNGVKVVLKDFDYYKVIRKPRLCDCFEKMLELLDDKGKGQYFGFKKIYYNEIYVQPVLDFIEILGLGRCYKTGMLDDIGEITICDRDKLLKVDPNTFNSEMVAHIKEENARHIKELEYFFRAKLSTKDRWDLIESYFLGADILDGVQELSTNEEVNNSSIGCQELDVGQWHVCLNDKHNELDDNKGGKWIVSLDFSNLDYTKIHSVIAEMVGTGIANEAKYTKAE